MRMRTREWLQVVERAASKAMLKGEHEHKCLVACNRTRSLAHSLRFASSSYSLIFSEFLQRIQCSLLPFDQEFLRFRDAVKRRYLVTSTDNFYYLHSTFFKCHRILFLPVRFAFSLIILLTARRVQQHFDSCRR